ncbi:MAG: alpha/beta hydrolase [Pseudomonadota bacterium]
MTLNTEQIDIVVSGAKLRIACLRRTGSKPPLVCLHGFGSTKEDYADLALHPVFDKRGLILLDAPGCGQSTCDAPEKISIPFLRDVAGLTLDRLGVEQFHLLGHSMGGLTALMLAVEKSSQIKSFTNIEGNVAPEDCFLSRQIHSHPGTSPSDFLDAFIDRVSQRPEWSSRLYAAALAQKIDPAVVAPIFQSMVRISDSEPLLKTFTGFLFPRQFVFGEQNRHLSYLNTLQDKGVELAEIASSGHFPMYSNPQALWSRLGQFLARCETA